MTDHDNLDAFVLNDESEQDDEHSPEQLDIDLKRFNETDERYYSDIDPDL